MDASVSAKDQYLSKQAEELVYLERKTKKLSAASKPVDHIASFMLALQICLLNFCILLAVCDEPIRTAVLQIPICQKISEIFSIFPNLETFSFLHLGKALLLVIVILYAIPLLVATVSKWIIFTFASPTVLTKSPAPNYTALASDAQRIYDLRKLFPYEALSPRFVWAAILYVISAVPFVSVLLKSGLDSSYIGTEIFALVLWLLLIMLAIWLLAFPIRPAVRMLISGFDTYYQAKDLSEKLEALRAKKEPRQSDRQKTTPAPKANKAETSAPARSTSASSGSSSASIDKYNSFTWTYGYVRDNQDSCSSISLSCLNVAKELLEEGDTAGAFLGFEHVVRGLELLQNFDEETYQPPLYANAYALSRIAAFSMKDLDAARKYIQMACNYASKHARSSHSSAARAGRDLSVMQRFSDAISAGYSASQLYEDFGDGYPYDIING